MMLEVSVGFSVIVFVWFIILGVFVVDAVGDWDPSYYSLIVIRYIWSNLVVLDGLTVVFVVCKFENDDGIFGCICLVCCC